MPNPNARHSTPIDERNYRPGVNDDQRFMQDDDRYVRTDRPVPRQIDPDDGGFRSRDTGPRPSDPYAQGPGGYVSGRDRDPDDRSSGFQSRNQGYPGSFEDHTRGDDRYAGRGGSAYWQPERNPDRVAGPGGYAEPTGYGTYGYGGGYPPSPASRRRHMVGNYGYGSDSYSTQGGSMLDQNQGVGQQGHFGGSPGGYGHVGSYGPEGGAQNHGSQGWQGNQGWEGHRAGPPTTGGHRGKGPKNFMRSDERLREAVSEALEIHDDIDATSIEVLVKGGEVTLSGSVDDRHAKRLAEDIAASVSGVRDVQNLLKVGNGYTSAPEPSDPKKARA